MGDELEITSRARGVIVTTICSLAGIGSATSASRTTS